jgi:hypothetical protein
VAINDYYIMQRKYPDDATFDKFDTGVHQPAKPLKFPYDRIGTGHHGNTVNCMGILGIIL